jgi:hypothetical protein
MVVLEPNGAFLHERAEESACFEPGLRRLSELLPAALALHGISVPASPTGDWLTLPGVQGAPSMAGALLSVG